MKKKSSLHASNLNSTLIKNVPSCVVSLFYTQLLVLIKSECVPGHFGMDCREFCSGHCESNDPCDHVSGVCPDGCQDGYMELYCNRCKRLVSLL